MKREIRSAVGEREQRFIPATSAIGVRAKDGADLPTIEGHGALFNDETVIGSWFRERILPGAFKDSLATDDIRVAFNHDYNCILGRTSAGTATVEEDKQGLKYTAEPPDVEWARGVVLQIKRKDITGSSFSFTVEHSDDEEWDYSETKKGMLPLRTIKKARLYETGPVAFPAYENTTVSARAMSKVEEAKQLRAAADAETCPACSGSGLNPERHMSDPRGQSPCDRCKGNGKRDGADQPAVAAALTENQQHPEPPAEMPVELLERELDLLEL